MIEWIPFDRLKKLAKENLVLYFLRPGTKKSKVLRKTIAIAGVRTRESHSTMHINQTDNLLLTNQKYTRTDQI